MRTRLISTAVAILATVMVWAAESPERMVARHLADEAQQPSRGGKSWATLPIADGPQDRLDNWIAAQPANRSIIRDDYTVGAGLNAVTAAPGLQLAWTTYDFQHNDAVPHQIGTILSPAVGDTSHLVHFVWTHWDIIPESLNRIDRFVNFQSYNSATGHFIHGTNGLTISGAGGDPLQGRAGFITMDVDDNDRTRAVAHVRDAPEQPSGDYCSYYYEQSASAFSVFTEGVLNGSKGVLGNFTDDVIWPHVTVDRQPGTDYFYVVSHTYSANSNLVFWRCTAPMIWQGPYVIDSTPSLSYNIAADPTSDKIALVTENATPSPSNPHGILQIVYRPSPARGDDWGAVNTTGLGDSKRVFVTSYNDAAGPGAWLDVVGDYDNAGKLHIVWNEQRVQNSSEQGSWKHWDDVANTITTIHQAYWNNTGAVGGRDINIKFPSIGFGDGSTTCGSGTNLNYVYLTFCQFGGETSAEQHDQSAHGYMNGEVYLSGSTDGGIHWSPAQNLTNSRRPGCDPARGDSCPSENWPSLARTVNDTLHLMYINDRDAGDAVFGQGNWTFNPVMYYRIPGGTNAQLLCPTIAPNAAVDLSDANGADCEYNTPPNTSLSESLTISNPGNAAMTGQVSIQYLNPPSGAWLLTATGGYTIPPGGMDDVRPVVMSAAGLSEGLYRAQISVTHNDPTKTSPVVLPVDFFVFHNFACPEYVTLHTNWLELEVSSVDRVAMGPLRYSGTGIGLNVAPIPGSSHQSMAANVPVGGGIWGARGLYRAPRFGSPDSGNNTIYDASLIIARTPTPSAPPPGDTTVYRYLFGQGNYARGFRALSGLTVDSSNYGTGAGMVTARAQQATIDSLIGIDVEYQFPQSADSSNFVIITYKIFKRAAGTISGLIIGEAADFDIIPSAENAKYQIGTQNKAAYSSAMNLVYQTGADSGATTLAQKYMGGMTAIQCTPAPRAWLAPNDQWLFKNRGGGFYEGYLYAQLVKSGFEIIPASGGYTKLDWHSVMAFAKNVSLSSTTAKRFALGFVTSTAGPDTTDLMATTRKAWRFAFGWQDVVTLDTISLGIARSYPYWASGSHENGPTSGCCGCVVSKVSGSPLLTIAPDPGNCTGTITFAGSPSPGSFTATFRVATPTCTGPLYTEDHVVTILAGFFPCNCPDQGRLNADSVIDVLDIIALIDYVFSGAAQPVTDPICPTDRGEINCDGADDVLDVVDLIDYVFAEGQAPCNPCACSPYPSNCP
ncbi:MAG: hypothetical protein HZB43_01610 [candidate division Zixibacteria bacterium]|nr:hypothetical protein [candidate division Zixibacteria bacterium]